MKRFLSFLLCLLMISCLFNVPVKAEDGFYYVYDCGSQEKTEFSNYNEAYIYWQSHSDEYLNLCLSLEDKLINMEYGIVVFDDENEWHLYTPK